MQRTTFPTPKDLPGMQREQAQAALAELRRFVKAGLAEVYTRPRSPQAVKKGERPRWNIWFDRRCWPAGEQRIELPTWAAAWVEIQHSPENGGDAA